MAAITLPLIKKTTPFPNVETALSDPDGLLAFGGDLSVSRLVEAYQRGIFPWFSDGEPILWWSPSTRCIIDLNEFHISRSLRKVLRKQQFRFSLNTAFENVIMQCAKVPRYQSNETLQGTWITQDMITAYLCLHYKGYAHSVEVWLDNELVGGLYGVVTDNIFCGESMFHTVSDASKAAMAMLISLMKPFEYCFIDCQMPTEHLMSLGAKPVNRKSFIQRMQKANKQQLPDNFWRPRGLNYCLD